MYRTEEHQLPDALREGAACRSDGEQRNAPQHHGPAAKAVCQGAVKQVHEGEPEKVGRQRLLHLNGRGAQGRGNAGKGWQIGINRKRPQHAQNGEQNR